MATFRSGSSDEIATAIFVSLSEGPLAACNENKDEPEDTRAPTEFPTENATTTCVFVHVTTQTEASNASAIVAQNLLLFRSTIFYLRTGRR